MIIFYGVCGEGQGHAGRSLTLTQRLMQEGHEVHVFTFGEGTKLFRLGGFPLDRLHEIPGITFGIKNGQISIWRTLENLREVRKQWKRAKLSIQLEGKLREPGLFITDFEPLVPRVGRKLGVPVVSVDNQHKLATNVSHLPLSLQFYCLFAKGFVRWMVGKVKAKIICTFHSNQIDDDTKQCPVMVRENFARLKGLPQQDFVLVYTKPYMQDAFLKAISGVDGQFRVYGTKNAPPLPNVTCKETSNDEFARDLATCKAVIACAGNQLLGEARFFGKPILAVPVPNQSEQTINAIMVEKSKIGRWATVNDLTDRLVSDFLSTAFPYEPSPNGVDCVMEKLAPFLK